MNRPRWGRLTGALVVTGVFVAGCSGTPSGESDEGEPAPPTTAAVGPELGGTQPVELQDLGDGIDDSVRSVSISASWTGVGGDVDGSTELAVDVPAGAVIDGGPFGDFGSCSGLRDAVGAYSVFVSDAVGVRSVAVWTADRVVAAGIYDAEVRIERRDRVIVAAGTITIAAGLQSGDFLAFGPAGGRVSGTFHCGGTPSPAPVDTGEAGDAKRDAVEVFAVLRRGDQERVVGLAAGAETGASCAAGPDGIPVVDVRGDDGLGAITRFEASARDEGLVSLDVAGVTYDFAPVTFVSPPGATAGTFTATSPDGVSVEGAFRCT